ncbi:MAG: pirin family protein [Betaproteobacteria bacterium]|nr:pirin family protein [Betaproteobacteria bacterium]
MTDPGPIRHLEPLAFAWKTRDPFLFCVHHDDRYPAGNDSLGPKASLAGRNLGNDFEPKDGWRMYHGERVPGFPAHPHRGFETVTVVRRGLIDHADSLGAAARYGGGDVQWLTAGGGIQHAEMFPLLDREGGNPLELFQIWLNLPAADKMAEPHFSMIWNEQVPRVRDGGAEVTLVAGALAGTRPPSPPPRSWASRADADVAIWIVRLEPGAKWTLPPAARGSNRSLYHFEGSGLRVGGTALPDRHLAEVAADIALAVEAGATPSQFLVLQGRPIAEPVAQYGPFVMNTRAELQRAFDDYRRTGFGGWPWPDADPVHGREGRFARHADGRVERPPQA